MNIDLSGKIALITGATGQLGRVMTRTLASCGADVVIHYHSNRAKAEELLAEIDAMGRRAMIAQADIADGDSINQMRDQILDRFGRVDVIVANAVSQYQWTSVLEQPAEDYLDQFQSCVMQSVHLFKAFVPGMMERNYGRIVGINTECSMQAFSTQSAYVTGKRGMDGLYRVMAKEVGPHNITINQVAPGWTISERDREAGTEKSEAYDANVPLRRRGTDQEISNAVAFLLSDLASFITGVYLPVSGGSVMPAI